MFATKIGESVITTGTGTFQLTQTAYGSFRTWRSGNFASSVAGPRVFYLATNDTGSVWEVGYGDFATGTPDTLTRNPLASSTGGSLINWVTTPYRVYNVPSADALAHLMSKLVNGVGNVPPWLSPGGDWLDYSLGYAAGLASTATAWVKKRFISGTRTAAGSHAEEGRFHIGLDAGATHIYAASQRKKFEDKGAASYTFTANDIGKVLAFNCSAAGRTLTMLANNAAGMGHGAYVDVYPYGSTVNGVTFTPGGADTTDLATAPAGRVTRFEWDGTRSKWVADYITPATAPAYAGVRQTVAAGPVDTSGLPSFLPNTNAALSITSQNVSSSAPLVASAANGSSGLTGEPVDTVGYSTANLTWSSLANNTTNYLYGTIAGGVITPASTTLAPVYQWGGTPAVTSGQITFNIAEMKAYLGNGTTAPQTNLVVFGEAVTSAGSVTSTVAYAYNGKYQSGFTATLPGAVTTTTVNHNIGVQPDQIAFIVECTSAEGGYSVGDRITNPATTTTVGYPTNFRSTSKTLAVVTGSNHAWQVVTVGGGADQALTAANWKYKLVAARGW